MLDIGEIKATVQANEYAYTHHADIERTLDNLTFAQIEEALLTGRYLSNILTPGGEKVA